MKKIILITFFFFLTHLTTVVAQLQYYFEDFDQYVTGQPLACQNPIDWTTLNNLPCDPIEDPYLSSNHAFSGLNSVKIVHWNDLIKPLGNISVGRNHINFRSYVPNDKVGYFSLLSQFNPNPTEQGVECYFDVGGIGRLEGIPGAPITFTYTNSQWQHVWTVVDFEKDEAQLWIDNTLIHIWNWTQNGTITSQIAAQNFYGPYTNNEMYIDDYELFDNTCLYCTPPLAPNNLTAQQIFDPGPRILLNWQSNFWNQFAFKIIRKNGLPNDPSNYELISFVPQNVTQYTDSNVVIDSTYTYGVIAFNMFGYSDTSNTVSITIDPVTILKETKTISTFSLSQNYPNPFNPTTKIKYTIPSIETRHASSLQMVTLKVYDVLGNEIATLVNEEKPAGEYEVEFTVGQDSSPDIASGIYFYRLTAGDFIQTKKMVLLR